MEKAGKTANQPPRRRVTKQVKKVSRDLQGAYATSKASELSMHGLLRIPQTPIHLPISDTHSYSEEVIVLYP